MVLNKTNKWVKEYTKTLQSKPGKVYKGRSIWPEPRKILRISKVKQKICFSTHQVWAILQWIVDQRIKSENSPGNRLEESDLESYEWDKK